MLREYSACEALSSAFRLTRLCMKSVAILQYHFRRSWLSAKVWQAQTFSNVLRRPHAGRDEKHHMPPWHLSIQALFQCLKLPWMKRRRQFLDYARGQSARHAEARRTIPPRPRLLSRARAHDEGHFIRLRRCRSAYVFDDIEMSIYAGAYGNSTLIADSCFSQGMITRSSVLLPPASAQYHFRHGGEEIKCMRPWRKYDCSGRTRSNISMK